MHDDKQIVEFQLDDGSPVYVEVERYLTQDVVRTTEALVTLVAVNAAGKSIPFDSPPTVGEGEMDPRQ